MKFRAGCSWAENKLIKQQVAVLANIFRPQFLRTYSSVREIRNMKRTVQFLLHHHRHRRHHHHHHLFNLFSCFPRSFHILRVGSRPCPMCWWLWSSFQTKLKSQRKPSQRQTRRHPALPQPSTKATNSLAVSLWEQALDFSVKLVFILVG